LSLGYETTSEAIAQQLIFSRQKQELAQTLVSWRHLLSVFPILQFDFPKLAIANSSVNQVARLALAVSPANKHDPVLCRSES